MINAIFVFIIVIAVNWLASEFNPFGIANPLLNVLFWSAVVSLFVGVGTRNFTLQRRV